LRQVARKCNIAHSTVKRIVESTLDPPAVKSQQPKQRKSMGRPRKISARMERYILHQLEVLRREEGTFTIKRLMMATGLSESDISIRSVSNVLYRNGIRMYHARRKGVLSQNDLKTRKKFAQQCLSDHTEDYWMNDIAFYLDAVSFVYKTNPMDQATKPRGRVYRRRSEGLKLNCTSKGQKEGTGGKHARFVVAISYQKGVLICEPYEKMNGEFFEDFIDRNFETMFEACGKTSREFVQDGDPSQNSKIAMEALRRVNAQLVTIPPRSPDLNPIENIFHCVSEQLRKDAIMRNLQYESFENFQDRIVSTIRGMPTHVIDKTIASTHKRLKLIASNGGQRTKY